MASGGIALFDEPELHLNPAVSRDVLPFILNNYSKPRNIQFIMCSHSPEILSGAFSNENCALLHLKSATDITRVGKKAIGEYSDALTQLGTSVSESLLYDGTILVEGDDDVAFLEIAYTEIFRKFKVNDRGGRREVEKTIVSLQELENKGQKVAPIYVIFDKDEEVTSLKSSDNVKIMQWSRRAIENFMIDSVVIAEILSDESATRTPIESEGGLHKTMREIALGQLDEIAARETYNSLNYMSPSLTKADLSNSDTELTASKLYSRMINARNSIAAESEEIWQKKYLEEFAKRKSEMVLIWESKWRDLCDGNKLLSEIHKRNNIRISESAFKVRIIQKMRDNKSDDWRLVKGLLEDLIGKPL